MITARKREWYVRFQFFSCVIYFENIFSGLIRARTCLINEHSTSADHLSRTTRKSYVDKTKNFMIVKNWVSGKVSSWNWWERFFVKIEFFKFFCTIAKLPNFCFDKYFCFETRFYQLSRSRSSLLINRWLQIDVGRVENIEKYFHQVETGFPDLLRRIYPKIHNLNETQSWFLFYLILFLLSGHVDLGKCQTSAFQRFNIHPDKIFDNE